LQRPPNPNSNFNGQNNNNNRFQNGFQEQQNFQNQIRYNQQQQIQQKIRQQQLQQFQLQQQQKQYQNFQQQQNRHPQNVLQEKKLHQSGSIFDLNIKSLTELGLDSQYNQRFPINNQQNFQQIRPHFNNIYQKNLVNQQGYYHQQQNYQNHVINQNVANQVLGNIPSNNIYQAQHHPSHQSLTSSSPANSVSNTSVSTQQAPAQIVLEQQSAPIAQQAQQLNVRSPSPIVHQVVENQASQVENQLSPKIVKDLEKELEILEVVDDEVSPILPIVQPVEKPVEVETVKQVPSPETSQQNQQERQQQQPQQTSPQEKIQNNFITKQVLRKQNTPQNYHEIVGRKARALLNKITPDNFQRLSKELVTLTLSFGQQYANDFSTQAEFLAEYGESFEVVINLIFDKAIDEQNYTTLYVLLVNEILENSDEFTPEGKTEIYKVDNNAKTHSFLFKLQREFKNRHTKYVDTVLDKRSSDDKDLSPAAIAEREIRAKRQILGMMKFLGGLFNFNASNGMNEKIIHSCITDLLSTFFTRSSATSTPGVEAMHVVDTECVADLLFMCGQKLEEGEGSQLKNKVKEHFEKIDVISNHKDVPVRVQYLLKDLIDLRKERWQSTGKGFSKRVDSAKSKHLQRVSDVRKDAITKLYTDDPRVSKVPSHLISEVIKEKSSISENSNNRGRQTKMAKGFFTSPAGTRENSRDRRGSDDAASGTPKIQPLMQKYTLTKGGSADARQFTRPGAAKHPLAEKNLTPSSNSVSQIEKDDSEVDDIETETSSLASEVKNKITTTPPKISNNKVTVPLATEVKPVKKEPLLKADELTLKPIAINTNVQVPSFAAARKSSESHDDVDKQERKGPVYLKGYVGGGGGGDRSASRGRGTYRGRGISIPNRGCHHDRGDYHQTQHQNSYAQRGRGNARGSYRGGYHSYDRSYHENTDAHGTRPQEIKATKIESKSPGIFNPMAGASLENKPVKQGLLGSSPTNSKGFQPYFMKKPDFKPPQQKVQNGGSKPVNGTANSVSSESSSSESDTEVQEKVSANARSRRIRVRPKAVMQSFEEVRKLEEEEAERKMKEEEEKAKEEKIQENAKKNLFQPTYLTVKKPTAKKSGHIKPKQSLNGFMTSLSTQQDRQKKLNNMSMFSNVKPEPPKKTTNQEIHLHIEHVESGVRSVDSFVKENYFKKKSWLVKYLLERPNLDISIQILSAEVKNSGALKGLNQTIENFLKEDIKKFQAQKEVNELESDDHPMSFVAEDVDSVFTLARLYASGLLPIDLMKELIVGSSNYFPLNLQVLGVIYNLSEKANQKFCNEFLHNILFDRMLTSEVKTAARYGRAHFIQLLKNAKVFDVWKLKKGCIPSACFNRDLLSNKLNEISKETITEFVNLVKEKSLSIEVTTIIICEKIIRKSTAQELEKSKSENKPTPYQIRSEAINFWENKNLVSLLRKNGLQTLYGCQVFFCEMGYPSRLLMLIFHQLYKNDVVDVEVFEEWVEHEDESYEGKKKALFAVTPWLKAVRGEK